MEKMIRIIERMIKEKEMDINDKVVIYVFGYKQYEGVIAEVKYEDLKQKANYSLCNGKHCFEIE